MGTLQTTQTRKSGAPAKISLPRADWLRKKRHHQAARRRRGAMIGRIGDSGTRGDLTASRRRRTLGATRRSPAPPDMSGRRSQLSRAERRSCVYDTGDSRQKQGAVGREGWFVCGRTVRRVISVVVGAWPPAVVGAAAPRFPEAFAYSSALPLVFSLVALFSQEPRSFAAAACIPPNQAYTH